MGGGKGGGGSGPKQLTLSVRGDVNKIKSSGTIQYSSTERPIGVAFHSGRVFYFGFDIFGQPAIFFSQLLTTVGKAGNCYQEADPTAQEINDLVATDGGVLRPVGMGTPIAARETDFGVLFFCSNGVWIVRGPEGSGFSATNFQVSKITDKGPVGSQSIIEVVGAVLYFSEEAIIQLAPDDFGRIQAQDLTSDSIRSVYQQFSRLDLSHAKGAYIDAEKRAFWVIPSGTPAGQLANEGTFVLVLDTQVPGFYQWSTDIEDGHRLLLPFENKVLVSAFVLETLTLVDSTTRITTVSGALIEANVQHLVDGERIASFLVRTPSNDVKAVHATSNTFQDFGSVEYTSYVEFGYQYPTSKAGALSVPYIHSFFRPRRTDLFTVPELPCILGDVTSLTYTGKKYDVSADFYFAFDCILSANGSKLIVIGVNNDQDASLLVEYDLTTPWDVTTATPSGNSLELNQVSGRYIHGLCATDGGLLLYATQQAANKYWKIQLQEPFSLAGAVTSLHTLPSNGETTAFMYDIYFKDDGLSAYVISDFNQRVYQYTLSTAHDLTTSTYAGKKVQLPTDKGGQHALEFNSNGTYMYTIATFGETLLLYELATPWDVSTASPTGDEISLSAVIGEMHGFAFSSRATDLYVPAYSERSIYQFETRCRS